MEKATKSLILEVSAGIIVFTVVVMVGAFFIYPESSVFAGLFLGMVVALAMFLSMALVLEHSMKTMNPGTVQKRSVISTVVRYLVLIIILVVIITRFSDQINPVALVIGVLGLKAGAFLQPVIHRIAARKTPVE